MRSIKYLLMSIIGILLYESSFPKDFMEYKKEDWWFFGLIILMFWLGAYFPAEKK